MKIRSCFTLFLATLLCAANFATFAQRRKQAQTTSKPSAVANQAKDTETWRKNPPPPAPAKPLNLPSPHQVTLNNGLTLVLVESRRIPVVSFSLGLRVGDVDDPLDLIGLSDATAAQLTEGAGSRSSEQLARDVESLGGQIAASSNDDYTEVAASVIAENAEAMFDIFADVVLRPTFPDNELELYKKNREQNLIVQRQDPAFLATEQFRKAIYGKHPYAVTAPTPETIAALDRDKVEAFYKANFTPSGSVLIINGLFDAAKMEAKARALFGNWQAIKAEAKNFPAPGEANGRRIILVDRPDSEQADFRVGGLGVARADADFYPLLVANAILGDGTSSRLFLNIREKKGYTYDVSSSVIAPRMKGLFFGSSETRNEVTGAAIKEMLAEFERIRTQPVTETDLRNAKNYLNGNFSLSLSTQGGITSYILRGKMLGLPPDYLKTFRERIEAVTAEQVQQAARKYIPSANAVIVVVGDAKQLKGQLAMLGKVEVLDIMGKPVN